MMTTIRHIIRIVFGTLKIGAVLDAVIFIVMLLLDEPMDFTETMAMLIALMLFGLALLAVPYVIWRIVCLIRHEHEPDLDDFKDAILTLPGLLISLFLFAFSGSDSSGSSVNGSGGRHASGGRSPEKFGGGSSRGGGGGRSF